MPKLKARAPGRAWKKGFFSMGSQYTALTYPVGAYSVPPLLKRTLQTPAKPGGMGQRWPQAKHSTRWDKPPGLSIARHNSAGAVWRASCAASVSIGIPDLIVTPGAGWKAGVADRISFRD